MDEYISSPSGARYLGHSLLILRALGIIVLLVILGRPVYWKLRADVIDPFIDQGNGAPVTLESQPAMVAQGSSRSGQPAFPTLLQLAAAQQEFNPDDPKYKITVERAHQLAQDGYIMVTFANKAYTDFALSWAYNVHKAGISGYLVGAMDDDILKSLAEGGINTWRMNSGLSKGDFGWGSAEFRKAGREKTRLALAWLATGLQVIISDIDTAWMRNPIPFFSKYPEADCLTSSDLLRNTVRGEELERWPEGAWPDANIGIMLFRNGSIPLVKAWDDKVEAEDIWDQSAFNNIYRVGMAGDPNDPTHLFSAFGGKVKVGILPVSLFSGGHTFFVQRMHTTLGLEPYVGHATFQYSGTQGKRNRFREFLLWHDPPEYFDHTKGFITFNMDLPQELLEHAAVPPGRMLNTSCVEGHFRLVNHQLRRLRNAFAIATLTGRALILPQLWCGADKYWAPLESGRIPGTQFKLPFVCPADHVLDLENGLEHSWPTDEYGPHIEWREYSFLQNRLLTAAVNYSRVTIEVCGQDSSAGCADGTKPLAVKDKTLRIAPSLSSDELLAALAATERFKILEFSTMEQAFGNFTDEADWTRFSRRMGVYASTWCCLEKQDPTWVWYDLMWDMPHNDRFQRPFQTWRPVFGNDPDALMLASSPQ